MFAVLRKTAVEGGFFTRWKAKRGKLPPTVSRASLYGVPFYLIRCPAAPDNVFFPMVQKAAEPFDEGIVPGREIIIPEKYSGCLQRASDRELLRRLLMNAAMCAARGKTVLLRDRDGSCTGVAAEFLSFARRLYVSTDHPGRYQECALYCRRQYGAEPQVTDQIAAPPDCALIAAPYGLRGFHSCGLPVYSPDHNDKGYYVTSEDVVLPLPMLRYLPPDIDRVLFAAKLFEHGNIPFFFSALPLALNKNGEKEYLLR